MWHEGSRSAVACCELLYLVYLYLSPYLTVLPGNFKYHSVAQQRLASYSTELYEDEHSSQLSLFVNPLFAEVPRPEFGQVGFGLWLRV